MQRVAVVAQCDACAGRALRLQVDVGRRVDYILPLGVHLHQHLVLAHHLHHLADVAARVLQLLQLVAQSPHARVQFVALSLEAAQVGLLRVENELEAVDLRLVVRRQAIVAGLAHDYAGRHGGSRGLRSVARLEEGWKEHSSGV